MKAAANVAFGLSALVVVAWLTRGPRANAVTVNPLAHDGPLLIIYLVGAWVWLPLGFHWAAAYLGYVLGGSWWFIIHVCPSCQYHGRGDGPSLYCATASRLTTKGDAAVFGRQFHRHVPVIALAWLLPPIGGAILLVRAEARVAERTLTLFALATFELIAFYLVPSAAKTFWERCENREVCPRCKPRSGAAPGNAAAPAASAAGEASSAAATTRTGFSCWMTPEKVLSTGPAWR